MRDRSKYTAGDLQAETRQVPAYDKLASASRCPTLTIVYHPDLSRIGERIRLQELGEKSGRVGLSRLEPAFIPPFQPDAGLPLATSFLSRRPIWLNVEYDDSITLDVRESGTALEVDGVAVPDVLNVSRRQLERGVVLELAGQVGLFLHLLKEQPSPDDRLGMIGDSDGIAKIRRQIARVARVNAPVLIRGETGTGKELVAQAVHYSSARKDQPYLTVNMAAIPSSLAASELFGHTRGAFSGAKDQNLGFFGRADTGTLFLDEIGDTPTEVQAALLRVLETGEVQRLGADKVNKVDVRLIAATDADIDTQVEAGRFRAPLYYRLANQEIRLPPLRERRDDIGRLLYFFLRSELTALGRVDELDDKNSEGMSWLPAPVVMRLVRYHWPGNVRQLRNVARFLASQEHGAVIQADDPALDRLLVGSSSNLAEADSQPEAQRAGGTGKRPQQSSSPAPAKRSPSEIPPDEVARVLQEHDYKLGPTSVALGISRPALNDLVDGHETLTRANNLSLEAIQEVQQRCDGDVEVMWRQLKVSKRGLTLRMKNLGLL